MQTQKCGDVLSGSKLFATMIFHQKKKKEQNRQNRPDAPKITNGLIHNITVEESTSIQWVKKGYIYISFFVNRANLCHLFYGSLVGCFRFKVVICGKYINQNKITKI